MSAKEDGARTISRLLHDLEKAARQLRRLRRRVLYLRPGDYLRKSTALREQRAEIGRLQRWAAKLAAQVDSLGTRCAELRWSGLVASAAACLVPLRQAAEATLQILRLQREKIRNGQWADAGVDRRTIFRSAGTAEKALFRALRRAARLERLWLAALDRLQDVEPSDEGRDARRCESAAAARLAEVEVAMGRVHFDLASRRWKRLLRVIDPQLRRLDLQVVRGLLAEVESLCDRPRGIQADTPFRDLAGRWARVVATADACLELCGSEDGRVLPSLRLHREELERFINSYQFALTLSREVAPALDRPDDDETGS